MNLCNDPDHGAINAERAESRGLRKAWVDLDDKRQILERELTAVTKERDELRRWTSVNGVIDLQCQRDEARGQRDRLAEALRKLADCDWVITPKDRMDAVREIARNALQFIIQPSTIPK